MRSNSNEFLDSPIANSMNQDNTRGSSQKNKVSNRPLNRPQLSDSDNQSFVSSNESTQKDVENPFCFLVCAVTNQFQIIIDNKAPFLNSDLAPDDSRFDEKGLALLAKLIHGIKLFVWPCFRMPTSGSVIPLINTSFLFATRNYHQERMETDFLVALSMVNSRKFIQASEKFRKIEQQLLMSNDPQGLTRAMMIEIIIGESMNQHSQISEKVYAFQRAVTLSLLAQQYEQDKTNSEINFIDILNQIEKVDLKQDEASRALLQLQPHLVRILVQNIDNQIEAVRLSALKTLEYLVETLGCSLDFHLVNILVAIVNSYPTLTTPKRYVQGHQTLIRSFFESNEAVGNSKTTLDLKNKSRFFSLADINTTETCQIKDVQVFHQSYVQSSKNYHNHILESLLFLVSSMAPQLLLHIFNDVIQKCLFSQEATHSKLPIDLKSYLLKLAEKIIHICQGDLLVNPEFIQNTVNAILTPDTPTTDQLTLQHQETFAQNCVSFWHSLKTNLIAKQSKKGKKALINWITQQLILLSEKANGRQSNQSQNLKGCQPFITGFKTIEGRDLHQLLIMFELIELLQHNEEVINNSNQESEILFIPDSQTKPTLQSIISREARLTQSDAVEYQQRAFQQDGMQTQQLPLGSIFGKPVAKRNKLQKQSLAIEMSVMLRPIIYWLHYSIDKQERLPLFKIIWKVLCSILNAQPMKRRLDFDCISIILPVLQRVDDFCQSSSPQQEMLIFLQTVLTELKHYIFKNQQQCKNRVLEFIQFMDKFVYSFAKIIPHNLHDEVFTVCELILDIMGSTGNLKADHVRHILNALIHKYTMRSKAYKKLMQHFVQVWVLDYSVVALEQNPQAHVRPVNTLQRPQRNSEDFSGSVQEETNIQEVLGAHNRSHEPDLAREQHQNEIDRLSDENEIEDTRHLRSQSSLGVENIQDVRDINSNSGTGVLRDEVRRPIVEVRDSNQDAYMLHFDTFCEECLMRLRFQQQLSQGQSEQVQAVYEKLSVFLEMIKAMTEEHLQLYRRLVQQPELKDALVNIFKQERSQTYAIKIVDAISAYFVKHSAPKNVYEHPVFNRENVAFDPQRPGQQSGRHLQIGQHQQHPIQTEPSVDQQIELDYFNQNEMQASDMGNLHYSQIYRQNQDDQQDTDNEALDGERHLQHPEQQQQAPTYSIRDEIRLLNQECLILIQLFSTLARIAIDQMQPVYKSNHPQQQLNFMQLQQSVNNDAQLQLHALNMLQNLFSNLLPAPTFHNIVMKHILNQQQDDPQRQQQRLQFYFRNNQGYSSGGSSQGRQQPSEAIPDFETMFIYGYSRLENGSSSNPTFPLEFECWDSRYIHGRLSFLLKVWPFLEQTLSKSSWSNVRALCTQVICHAVKMPNVSQFKSSSQSKLKQVLFPLLNNLLKSEDSESKASGLSILASFCGLSNVQLALKKYGLGAHQMASDPENIDTGRQRTFFDSEEGDDFEAGIDQHIDMPDRDGTIKISDYVWVFRQNSSIVSLPIWQLVFDLQDDWEQSIRAAATALIQLCAPQDSVKHFYKIKKEKYQLRLNEIVNTMRSQGNFQTSEKQNSVLNGSTATEGASLTNSQSANAQSFRNNLQYRASSVASQMSNADNLNAGSNSRLLAAGTIASSVQLHEAILGDDHPLNSNNFFVDNADSEHLGSDYSEDNETDSDAPYFYMDQFSEEQIQAVLAKFKLQVKPLKALWVDRLLNVNVHNNAQVQNNNLLSSMTSSFMLDGLCAQPTDKLSLDPFEDNMLEEVAEGLNQEYEDEIDEEEYIFKRQQQPEPKQRPQHTQQASNTGFTTNSDSEDLGIIDLDDQEGDFDDFEDLDDDKLPILKNTYSKKCRPNNSKSVAVGSRSQGGTLKLYQKTSSIREESLELFHEEQVKEENQAEAKSQNNSARETVGEETLDLSGIKSRDQRVKRSETITALRQRKREDNHSGEDDNVSSVSVADSAQSLPIMGSKQSLLCNFENAEQRDSQGRRSTLNQAAGVVRVRPDVDLAHKLNYEETSAPERSKRKRQNLLEPSCCSPDEFSNVSVCSYRQAAQMQDHCKHCCHHRRLSNEHSPGNSATMKSRSSMLHQDKYGQPYRHLCSQPGQQHRHNGPFNSSSLKSSSPSQASSTSTVKHFPQKMSNQVDAQDQQTQMQSKPHVKGIKPIGVKKSGGNQQSQIKHNYLFQQPKMNNFFKNPVKQSQLHLAQGSNQQQNSRSTTYNSIAGVSKQYGNQGSKLYFHQSSYKLQEPIHQKQSASDIFKKEPQSLNVKKNTTPVLQSKSQLNVKNQYSEPEEVKHDQIDPLLAQTKNKNAIRKSSSSLNPNLLKRNVLISKCESEEAKNLSTRPSQSVGQKSKKPQTTSRSLIGKQQPTSASAGYLSLSL